MSYSNAIAQNKAHTRRIERSGLYRVLGKRVFDILFTLVCAPIILVLVAAFALAVKRDGGPAFFVQQRVGKNGRVFNCYKLRTMVMDAERVLDAICKSDPELALEWKKYQKLQNDPRITQIGRFLRATSLDELPQFWNVFIGDMSIIGPRPFMPEQQDLYGTDLSAAYYQLRPGISGAWQVSARNDTTFAGRVAFDETYYAEIGLLSDLSTIARTVGVVFGGKGQ